jgi:hypothetical protein
MDEIRELFDGAKLEIDLPSIAVVGNQSAGKTSVLERLSGVDLPRGEGMVTRCALVLRMVNNSRTGAPESYAIIRGGKQGEQRIPLSDVAMHVSRITDELAAPNEISEEAIYLTVYSPEVPDLSLVDLPGIVYTDAQGKKSPITDAIHRLYKKHIDKKGCVILCALPANADFRTQQVSAWAHEVDPEGKRTLGVITKIDKAELDDKDLGSRLLGQGPNAWAFKLGNVALRNRTQAEMEAGADRASVNEAEERCFEAFPALRAMTPQQKAATLGVDALVRRLIHIQTEAIQAYLPQLELAIREKLSLCTTRLSALPKVCSNAYECLAAFTALTQEMANRVAEATTANYTRIHAFGAVREAMGAAKAGGGSSGAGGGASSLPGEPTNMDAGAASGFPPLVLALHMMPRVQELLERFATAVRGAPTPIFSPAYKGRVAEAMKECAGCSLPDSTTDAVFSELVAKEAGALGGPAEDLAHAVHDYMGGFASALVKEHFAPFPALANAVSGALVDFLKESLDATLRHIGEQCRMEAEPFTLNKDYMSSLKTLRAWQQERAEKTRANASFVPSPWSDTTAHMLLGGGTVEPGKGVAGATQAMRALDDEDLFSQAVVRCPH